jgi:hypothetical protein
MNKQYLFLGAVAVIGLFLALEFRGSPYGERGLDVFAECLAEKGITMYGADWCPHCKNEKNAFGESFRLIPYVECPEEPQKCIAAGISGYPTWIFPASLANPSDGQARLPDGQAGWLDAKKLEGEQGLRRLSEESGCPLPERQ